jgi:hypothetical protein
VNEQPFTRSLSGVAITADTTTIYIEVRDTEHGWSAERLLLDLTQAKDGYLSVTR